MSRGLSSNANWLEDASPQITAGPITLSCWVYVPTGQQPVNFAAAFGVAEVDTWTQNGWTLSPSYAGGGRIVQFVAYEAGSFNTLSETGGYSDDTWFHIAGKADADASDMKVYRDGTNTNSATGQTPRSPTGIDAVFVGTHGSNSKASAKCYVAECGAWNVELTDGEVGALALGYSPLLIRPGSLKHYYPLYESNAGAEPDLMNASTAAEVGTLGGFAHPAMYYGGYAGATAITAAAVAAAVNQFKMMI